MFFHLPHISAPLMLIYAGSVDDGMPETVQMGMLGESS
jgi:hypothetical protein